MSLQQRRRSRHAPRTAAPLVSALLVAVAGLAGCAGEREPQTSGGGTQAAASAFLSTYLDPDGRVVRRDQAGDTVSEGQAYAMLVAVGTGDRETFSAVWGWTREHLLRADGTLSWRWADGAVVDASSASDADLDAARALVLAGRRFADDGLGVEGVRLGKAVLDVETVQTANGRVLTAGSWTTTDPWAFNPSYSSPVAYAVLGQASGDPRWAQLAGGSRTATARILAGTALPPDWAQVHGDGRVDPMPGAAGRGGHGVRYGYDATRLPLRHAESCSADDRVLAGRLVGPFTANPGSAAERDLGGRALTPDRSVVALAGEAAALASTGDRALASSRLVEAAALQEEHPTYYGGAWAALGPLLLTSTVLGGCAPLAPA